MDEEFEFESEWSAEARGGRDEGLDKEQNWEIFETRTLVLNEWSSGAVS